MSAWQNSLSTCKWRFVTFEAIVSLSDPRFRRRARYGFPYRNGELLEDMGREARPTRFTAIFRGDTYVEDLATLQQAVDSGKTGTFTHPFFGSWPAKLDITINHDPSARDQATVEIDVLEDGTDAEVTGGFTVETSISLVEGTITTLQAVMAAIEQAEAAVEDAVDEAIARAEEVVDAVNDVATEIDRKMNECRSRVSKARKLAEAAYPPNVAGKVKKQMSIMARRTQQLADAAKLTKPTITPKVQRLEGPLHFIVAQSTGGMDSFDEFVALNRIRNPNRVIAGSTVATFTKDTDA